MASARPRRLRDGEVAGVGARAGDDVAGELGAGLGHADARRGGRRASGSCVLGEVAEREVLAVGDAHVERRSRAGSAASAAELVGGDVAEPGVGVRPRPCPWRRRARRWPRSQRSYGSLRAQLDRRALADGRRRDAGGDAGRRVAAASATMLGDAARPAWTRPSRNLRSLRMRSRSSSMPMRVDEPLHAGPQLVVAVAVVVERCAGTPRWSAAGPRAA